MKKIFVWMVLIILTSTLSVSGQNKIITVSGNVIEGDSNLPAEQASVQLYTLPDSALVAGTATGKEGEFTLPKVKSGKYVLKISYIGFYPKWLPLRLTSNAPSQKVGSLTLEPNTVLLKEAIITGEAPPVSAVEDTLVYNATAYRTPEGAMLEELVKKLPGAEIDDSGNVKINGKDLKKILVDGKEFFKGDVKTGLQNLPVEMIDKLKAYDKKSDMARITGIDDGDEETVLDLTVKKGMKEGWFGNANLAGGTDSRYASNFSLNRFVNNSQFTAIGSGNNVGDRGFSGGGGGGALFRSNNGLNSSRTAGVNFATKNTKLEMGGSARYNFRDGDAASINSSERFLGQGEGQSFTNSNNLSRNKGTNFNGDFRLEWKPDTLTNIIFSPSVSYNNGNNASSSQSGIFDSDPYSLVGNPNDYLILANIDPVNDPLQSIRVNTNNNMNFSKSNDLSANGSLQVNRKLNNKGRNITFRGSFGYGDNEREQYSDIEMRVYKTQNDSTIRQYITTPTQDYNYSAQLTYSEPIARGMFLQFSYDFQYRYSESDKRTYDFLEYEWGLDKPLPDGYQSLLVDTLGKYAEYRYYTHNANVGLRFIREKYQLNAGMSFQPQHTNLSYKKGTFMTDTTRNVFNFSPNVDLRYRFSKVSQLRFNYRGRAGQPSFEDLLPVTDNSNPLSIRTGNPGLKPSFSHTLRLSYNTYNAEWQRGINANVFFVSTQNSISRSTIYDKESGGVTIKPENINGDWNIRGVFGFNTALRNKKFTLSAVTRTNYVNNVDFLYDKQRKVNDKNTSTNLRLEENLSGSYRNDWFEFSLNGAINYNWERNQLRPESNQEPYSFSYGASTNITLPWTMRISTNFSNNSRRGYRDATMNRNELIWNAQISQPLLKGAASVSFEMYDILKQQTNISRSLTASMRSVSENNGINSYCMLRFIYRLNVFGGKGTNESNRRSFGGDAPSGHGGGGGYGGGARGSFHTF